MISIRKVEINNFRNISHLELDLKPDTSIITGKNKLGKSNVLNAINWVLTDTLLTDKYGVGENDIDSIVPINHLKGFHTSVKLTLTNDVEYEKIYKVTYTNDGSKINGHAVEYKRNGISMGTKKNFYDEIYREFTFVPAFNGLKINEVRLMTNPLYALLILDYKDLRKLLVAMGCSVTNEELYQMGFEYMRPLESKFGGRWDEARIDAKNKLQLARNTLSTHEAQLTLFTDIPVDYTSDNYNHLISKRDNLVMNRTAIQLKSNTDAVKELDTLINETRINEKQQINERNSLLDDQIKELMNQINDVNKTVEEKYNAATKDLKDEASAVKDDIIKLGTERTNIANEIREYEVKKSINERTITQANESLVNYADELGDLINPADSDKGIVCPYCNQVFVNFTDNIEGRKDELKKLIKDQQDVINNATASIEEAEDKLETLNKNLETLVAKNAQLHSTLNDINTKIASVKREVFNVDDLRNQVIELQQNKIKPLDNSKLNELQAQRDKLVNDAEAAKREEIQKINEKIVALDEEIAKESKMMNDFETREELKKSIAADQLAVNDAENWLMRINKFIQTMINLINKRAKEITGFDFVMLEENLTNDNVSEVCYATFGGIPFKDLNTADKFKYGIKFIEVCRNINMTQTNRMCQLPILADRLESVSFVEDIKTATTYQFICTRVNQEEKMKVE